MASKANVSCILFFLSLIYTITKVSPIGVNIDKAHDSTHLVSSSNRALQTYQGDLSCENGGVQGPINGEGLIGCICNNSTSTSYAAYAGLQCEYIATDYCVFGVSVSYVAFCVNYGICNDIVIDNSKGHPGCTCPPQYEGPHCEYARGSTPVWVIDPTKASEEVRMEQNTLSPGLIIVITLFSMAAFAGMISMIFFLIQNGHFLPLHTQRTSVNAAYFKALNQELDADGSGIRETVEMQESIRSGETRAKNVGESPILNDVDII